MIGKLNNEFERISNKADVAHHEVLYRRLSGGIEAMTTMTIPIQNGRSQGRDTNPAPEE
jgi:hypothetical protein